MTSLTIRSELPDDVEQISSVITDAFKQGEESTLVQNLRKTPRFIPDLSIIALSDNKVVGHVLFYPIKIVTGMVHISLFNK